MRSRLAFNSDGVVVGVVVRVVIRSAYSDTVQFNGENPAVGVWKQKTYSAYDSVAYNLVKTRLSDSEAAEAEARINQSQYSFLGFVIG